MAQHSSSEIISLCSQEFVIFQVVLLARVGDQMVCGDLQLGTRFISHNFNTTSHPKPEEVMEAINAALPFGFKVELDWKDCVAFISDKKNYFVFKPDGSVMEVKGSKWRGRDKLPFQIEFVCEYIRRYIFISPQAAAVKIRREKGGDK